MTDAPACGDFTSVVITVVGVQLIGNDGAPYTLTLSTPLQQDLLQLTNGHAVNLGALTVPSGTYQQIRLVLAPTTGNGGSPANYVTTVAGGTQQYALTTPSAQESGYKINGQFTVDPDHTVYVTVDFNACRSIVTAGNSGKYLLKPVIQAVTDDTAGAITGTAAGGAAVYAEDAAGHIIKSTNADPLTGNFTLSPLAATASGSAGYNIVVAPPQPATGFTPSPNFAPLAVFDVPVTAGQSTPVSSATLPTFVTTDQTFNGSVTLANTDADVLVLAQESITSPVDGSSAVLTIAETLADPAVESNNTTSTYTLTFADAAPQLAAYSTSTSGLSFAAATPAPTIAVEGFGSDGSTGVASATAPNDITMSGSGDTTFQTDN